MNDVSENRRHAIRGDARSQRLGRAAGRLIRAWAATWRVEVSDEAGICNPSGFPGKPVIYALWHDTISTIPPVWRRRVGGHRHAVVLTSASKDGAVLEAAMGVFGIDAVRLEATATEPMVPRPHRGPLEAAPGPAAGSDDAALADLVGRLGARIGLERVTRHIPTDSHIPGKTAHLAAAAFSDPPTRWPAPPAPRPLELFGPDPCTPQAPGRPPAVLRWRRGLHRLVRAEGPERIAPEWWLDDPAWRTGVRDYWRVETETGQRLWLFEARPRPGASAGWFVHGRFA